MHQYSNSLSWITNVELVQPVHWTCLLVGGKIKKKERKKATVHYSLNISFTFASLILNQRKRESLYLGACILVIIDSCVTGCRIMWFIVLCVWNIESEVGCWVPCKPLSNEESPAYTSHSLSGRPQNFTILELFHCC